MPTLRLPTSPPRVWPRFSERLRSPAVTARVGRVLGLAIGICFVTGLLSGYQYHPWAWLPEPATPVWGYRLTQGLHVTTGIASIPLLLLKLWSVYPRLFAWPPARSVVHAVERLSIGVLVAVALIELTTGFLNVLGWYAWPWPFVAVHRFLGFVLAGSVLLHVAVKLPVIRAALAQPVAADEPTGRDGLTRRGLLTATGAGVALAVVSTVGQSVGRLEPLAVLAPRRPSTAPQRVPVNKTAAQAGVRPVAAGWRLQVSGPRPFTLGLAELDEATDEARLPIACVEGWSVDAHWRGLRLLDVVRRAGGSADSTVYLHSRQRHGAYSHSVIDGSQLAGALLATHLNGERLDLDHGYPVRLIAPDRAGVLNTKWLALVEVR